MAGEGNEGWHEEAGGDWGEDLDLPDLGLSDPPDTPRKPHPVGHPLENPGPQSKTQTQLGGTSPRPSSVDEHTDPRPKDSTLSGGDALSVDSAGGLPESSAADEGWEAGENLGLDLREPESLTGELMGNDSSTAAVVGEGMEEAGEQPTHTADKGDEDAGVEDTPGNPGVSDRGSEVEERDATSSEEQEGGVSPLHGCWAALLEKQLLRGEADSVLRRVDLCGGGLVTVSEGRHLVSAARSAGIATQPTPKLDNHDSYDLALQGTPL
jgi:hypothetical protein